MIQKHPKHKEIVKIHKQSTKGVLYVRDIPENIKNKFKVICSQEGRTLSEVIEFVMERFIKEYNLGNIGFIKRRKNKNRRETL